MHLPTGSWDIGVYFGPSVAVNYVHDDTVLRTCLRTLQPRCKYYLNTQSVADPPGREGGGALPLLLAQRTAGECKCFLNTHSMQCPVREFAMICIWYTATIRFLLL